HPIAGLEVALGEVVAHLGHLRLCRAELEGEALERHGGMREVTVALKRLTFQLSPDRKSTRLNSSHDQISYAVFCLKKKKQNNSISTSSKDISPPWLSTEKLMATQPTYPTHLVLNAGSIVSTREPVVLTLPCLFFTM